VILSRSNIRKKTSYNYSRGFALPTILIASMIMLSVLLVSVASTAAIRVSLLSQTYNQMAQTAGDAGVVYAKACLDANGGVPQWNDSTPLGPNTDCYGTQLNGFTCLAGSVDSRCSVTVNGGATAQVLVVAGGGGGGSRHGGGGGAGGLINNTNVGVTGGTYPVVVGGGGSGTANGSVASEDTAVNGSNSSALGLTAIGGGAGRGVSPGAAGGSGGGGGQAGAPGQVGGIGTSGQGYAGGIGIYDGTYYMGGGGGGAGGVGGNASSPSAREPAGGIGISNSITGSAVTYAAGGRGGCYNLNTVGAVGAVNTGNGGGAAGGETNGGAAGGSGIVIISYPTGSITATVTGSVTTSTSGSNTIQKFTSNGTFTVTSAGNGAITSSFSVGLPTLTNGKAAEINSVGLTKLLRSSTGTAWRTYSQSSRLSIPITDVIAKVLVVAGGGGGGSDMGGGGGGGGVIYNASYVISTGNIVTVGTGGAGAPAGISQVRGYNGNNSQFGSITAIGGGGGGSEYSTNVSVPGSGGSGGGVAGCNQTTGSTGTTGQGYSGGGTAGCYYPGGGGGAGGTGSTAPATGGVGVQSDILGTSYYWGGGGGGSGYTGNGGNGGNGGGGGGAVGSTTGGSGLNPGSPGGGGSTNSQTNTPGGNGGANTGGGGGGGSHYNSNNKGGNGGSGIVIISYPTGSITAIGGTITTSGGNTIHTFTSSGNFQVGASQRTSCKAILDAGESTGDGIYWIYPTGSTGLGVYCDMTNDGGGWTLVLQNNSSVTTPSPNWTNAINSISTIGTFGSNLTSFDVLVGLSNWNYFGTHLRAEVGTSPSSISHKATYSTFSLNSLNNYALSLSGETIVAGGTSPGLYTYSAANTYQFTTYDADHDVNSGNCAASYTNHPWWYGACWDGSFFGGAGYQEAPYWTGSASDYYAYGSIWIK